MVSKSKLSIMYGLILWIYRLVLPPLGLLVLPSWWLRMLRRGGLNHQLKERFGFYCGDVEWEKSGALHVHASSVGEVMLGIKWILEYQKSMPNQHFVLATTTATGHAVATQAALKHVRVSYAPLDFDWVVSRYFKRFEPWKIVLIEAEVWPLFMQHARLHHIPTWLINARMSPRSKQRYERFAPWIKPLFSMLHGVCIQQIEDQTIWQQLGLQPEQIHMTGSLKFDIQMMENEVIEGYCQSILQEVFSKAPIVLAASTHDGEELLIARALLATEKKANLILVPRHAERSVHIKKVLEHAGFHAVLKSQWRHSRLKPCSILIVDSTGELKEWTKCADIVLIGKSFLAQGGQNPCEAIAAKKPIIMGKQMQNFEPLVTQLTQANACWRVYDNSMLAKTLSDFFNGKYETHMLDEAFNVIRQHQGATQKMVQCVQNPL